MTITISHSAAEGTLVAGDPRPHHTILKAAGFRWSRNIPGWYIRASRDKAPQVLLIERVADELRAVGFEVVVEIDTQARPTAEREDDLAERAERRAERYEMLAGKRAAESDEAYAKARAISDMIPMGQPVLVGHHSQRRHEKDLDRIHSNFGKSVEAGREAQKFERLAQVAATSTAHRESAPVTIRRIEKLEAEARDIGRKLTPCPVTGKRHNNMIEGQITCPVCYHDVSIVDGVVTNHGGANGEWQERLTARNEALNEELAFWRHHLDELKASGVRIYGPSDFKKGDRVATPHLATVTRVNKKSLTVVNDVMPGIPQTVTYERVKPLDQEVNA